MVVLGVKYLCFWPVGMGCSVFGVCCGESGFDVVYGDSNFSSCFFAYSFSHHFPCPPSFLPLKFPQLESLKLNCARLEAGKLDNDNNRIKLDILIGFIWDDTVRQKTVSIWMLKQIYRPLKRIESIPLSVGVSFSFWSMLFTSSTVYIE